MIGVAIISITLVPALIPSFIKAAAERGGKLAGAELHRHLQTLADLADAAAEPGHVVVFGPADRRAGLFPWMRCWESPGGPASWPPLR